MGSFFYVLYPAKSIYGLGFFSVHERRFTMAKVTSVKIGKTLHTFFAKEASIIFV